MTVTLELTPEIEARLAQHAAARGVTPEDYLADFLAENLPPVVEAKEKPFYERATKEEWLAEFHRWVDSHENRGEPYLSDEALRRENIYEDRI